MAIVEIERKPRTPKRDLALRIKYMPSVAVNAAIVGVDRTLAGIVDAVKPKTTGRTTDVVPRTASLPPQIEASESIEPTAAASMTVKLVERTSQHPKIKLRDFGNYPLTVGSISAILHSCLNTRLKIYRGISPQMTLV